MGTADGIPIDVSGVNSWPAAIVVACCALVVLAVLFMINRFFDRRGLREVKAETTRVGESITNGKTDYVVRKDLENVHNRIDGVDGRLAGIDSRIGGVQRDVGRILDAVTGTTSQQRATATAAELVDGDRA